MNTKTTKFQDRPPTLEEMRARLNIDSSKINSIPESTLSTINDNFRNQEEIKKKKLELMNGNKGLLKGVYNGATSSSYQETYR